MLANQPPRISPCTLNASTAYWLQVGMNRQLGSRIGEIQVWYRRIRKITARAGRLLMAAALLPVPAVAPTDRFRLAVAVADLQRVRYHYWAAP